jgi:outer membrane protein TolC
LPASAPRSDDAGALASWLEQVSQRNPGLRVAEARLRAAEFGLVQARVQLLMNRLRLLALGGQLDEKALARLDAALGAAQ